MSSRRGRNVSFREFVALLLLGGRRSGWLMAAFLMGLLVVAIVGDLIFSLAVDPSGTVPGTLRTLVVTAVLIAAAYGFYCLDRRRPPGIEDWVDEGQLAPPHAGLIWLFGPGDFSHLLFALRHHVHGGGGAHCWLVMQKIDAVQERYIDLSQAILDERLPTMLHPVYIESLEVEDSSRAVRSILERHAPAVGLAPEDVIADITGSRKPVTAGMVLAVLTSQSKTGEVQLEYITSDTDERGRWKDGTQKAVLVDISFSLTRGGEGEANAQEAP